jgi:hypothetical protein
MKKEFKVRIPQSAFRNNIGLPMEFVPESYILSVFQIN